LVHTDKTDACVAVKPQEGYRLNVTIFVCGFEVALIVFNIGEPASFDDESDSVSLFDDQPRVHSQIMSGEQENARFWERSTFIQKLGLSIESLCRCVNVMLLYECLATLSLDDSRIKHCVDLEFGLLSHGFADPRTTGRMPRYQALCFHRYDTSFAAFAYASTLAPQQRIQGNSEEIRFIRDQDPPPVFQRPLAHIPLQYSAGLAFDRALLHAFADAFVEHIGFFQLFSDPFEAVVAMFSLGVPTFTSVRGIAVALYLLTQLLRFTRSPGFFKCQFIFHGFPSSLSPQCYRSKRLMRLDHAILNVTAGSGTAAGSCHGSSRHRFKMNVRFQGKRGVDEGGLSHKFFCLFCKAWVCVS
jgi:hypothetical protein